MTLTEFLLARIAEDEEAAQEATGLQWHGQACEVRTIPQGSPGASAPYWYQVASMIDENHFRNALHIARHDPAQVLAECEAKRQLIQRYEYSPTCRCLRYLGLPYADHPDYEEDWRP